MAKRSTPTITLSHDFTFLSARIAAFQAEHAASHNELLAMDARRSLGAGKVRVTFRVRPKKGVH